MVSTTPDSIFTYEAAHDAPAARHAASRSDSCIRGRSSQTTPTPYVLGQTVPTAAPATRAVRHTHAFPLRLVQVAHASSSQNVMSIWTSCHMFDQFSFTRYLVGTPHYACFNEYTMQEENQHNRSKFFL